MSDFEKLKELLLKIESKHENWYLKQKKCNLEQEKWNHKQDIKIKELNTVHIYCLFFYKALK